MGIKNYEIIILLFFIASPLFLMAQKPNLVLPVGHGDKINLAAFSPDGKYVVTASSDNTAKLWETATGKMIFTLEGHRGGVTYAYFSPDEKFILTTSMDNTAKIWEKATGNLLYTLEGHSDDVWSATFSPDGKYIMTASADCKMKFWDVQSGKEIASLISVDATDWIVTTPSGLFDASEGVMKRMYYVKGLEVTGR